MRPAATCELWIDGARVADTGATLAGGQATALTDLQLTWGRDGQNEQPGPASCAFRIADPASGNNALDYVHVGSAVAVWAEGHIPGEQPDAYAETMDDGTFDSYPAGPFGYYAHVGGATGSIIDSAGRGRILRVERPQPTSDTWTVQIPPRQFSPPGELPNAWDDIPRAQKTDGPWRVGVQVRAPLGTTTMIMPSGFSSPYTTSGSVAGEYQFSYPSTGNWETYSFEFDPARAGTFDNKWVVLQVWVLGLRARNWVSAVGAWQDRTDAWQLPGIAGAAEIDNATIGRPTDTSPIRRVLAFSGEVSDLTMAPAGDGSVTVSANAMDLGAKLGNTVIGDNPWPVQTVAVRADRIAELAGVTSTPRVRIDPPLDALKVSYRDVDAQPSYALVQDLAQSAGGVLWAATHAVTGAYLWMENPAARAAVVEFALSGGVIIITGKIGGRGSALMSACDLLEDGVTWHQDSADVITVVAVTWLEQGVDDEGKPVTTERTETVTDTAALATWGTRRLSVGTELITATDAQAMAARLLAQARVVTWRLDGLAFDTRALMERVESVTDATRADALLDMLDGTSRMGLALTLADMPAYAPGGEVQSVYLEGGTYSYSDGDWILQLAATPSAGQGKSAQWGQLDPTWQWSEWDTDIAWSDTFGVAP